jgi:hypothetical protein
MILAWLDAGKAKEFGIHLADFYIKKMPIDAEIDEKTFSRKQQVALEKMASQIAIFKLQNKLNIYQKAQLGNTFKWRFKEAGFTSAHEKQMSDWLITQFS